MEPTHDMSVARPLTAAQQAFRGFLPGIALAAAVIVSLVAKAHLTRVLALDDPAVRHTLLLEAPLVIAIVACTYALVSRYRYLSSAALLTLNAVASFAMLATVVYASYFGQIITPDTMRFAGEATEVTSSITALLRPMYLLYAADLPLLIGAAFLLGKRFSAQASAPPTSLQRFSPVIAAACALLIATPSFLGAWRLPDATNSVAVARRHGTLTYQLVSTRTLFQTPSAEAKVDEEYSRRLIATISELREDTSGERIASFEPGEYADANLIVVMVEALQTLVIDLEVDGVEVTPELNRIAQDSWYFPRTHAQLARGNTSDAEFVMNTALYPPVNQAASVRWGAKTIPSLPRLLGEQGYRSVTLHPNSARFWNRTNLYAALGFDEYYDRSRIPSEPWQHWGAPDEVLFDVAFSVVQDFQAQEQPFYAQVVTITSHHPFDQPPEEYRPYKPSEDFAGTPVGDYLSSLSYTDAVIGDFVEALKQEGLWDTSIVVFFGDHFGLLRPTTAEDAELLEKLLGHPYNDLDYLRVPLMIHMPGQTQGHVVDDTLGQVDILPTLADPLGLDLSGFPHFGRNAFVRGDELVGMKGLVPAGSMLNDRVLFVPGIDFDDGNAFCVQDGSEIEADAKDREDYERMTELLRLAAEYTDALPMRQGADGALADAIIPNIETVSTETADP